MIIIAAVVLVIGGIVCYYLWKRNKESFGFFTNELPETTTPQVVTEKEVSSKEKFSDWGMVNAPKTSAIKDLVEEAEIPLIYDRNLFASDRKSRTFAQGDPFRGDLDFSASITNDVMGRPSVDSAVQATTLQTGYFTGRT